jgi:hypothetical protein
MELAYFNHASIAIVDKVSRFGFITDPWISSPAFSSWQPYPKPNETEFQRYLDTLEDYALVISHGHDDHCDDLYIKAKLSPSHIFIPKYSSQGFLKRIQRLCVHETTIVELEHGKPYAHRNFKLMATINPVFTNNDAIVAIRDGSNTVIHANDNWHTQPDDVLKLLDDFSKGSDITYLAQIGIAGSFPLYYLGLDDSEKKSLVVQQLRLQAESLERNSRFLGAARAYSYANESRFTYLDSSALYSSAIRNVILDDCVDQKSIYRGELANTNDFKHGCFSYYNLRTHGPFSAEATNEPAPPPSEMAPNNELINKLVQLNDQINNYLNESMIEGGVVLSAMSYQQLQCRFGSDDVSFRYQDAPVLYIYSTYHIWNEILSGSLNLESITIGGCGLLKKSQPWWNARFVHDALSRYGYRYQSMIKLNIA